MGLNLVGIKDFGHILNLNERLRCIGHRVFASRSEVFYLLKLDAVCFVPARHVGEDHGIAFVKALEDLNRVH